ncbi:MAG: hypothetical protein Q7S51_00530 [Gallionellaceae bacterium]|nr:hypothetical protein [Gallionellaceae bacterium]
MIRLTTLLCGLCLVSAASASVVASPVIMRNLQLGEAFYYAYQGAYIDAVAELDAKSARFYRLDDPNLDALQFQGGYPPFTATDFVSSARIIKNKEGIWILEDKVEQVKRNEEAYRQARIFFQNGQTEKALLSIEKIIEPVHDKIRNDALLLRAQISLANGKFDDAIKILLALQKVKGIEGFASYNLAIALIQSGQEKKGLEQLSKTGQINSNDENTLAIRDKANLVLGYRQIEKKQPVLAKEYFDRVRVSGPFSNKALLGSGWADATLGNFDRALVPWSILAKRSVTDVAVQESILAVPYAYAQLSLHGRAAVLYGSALEKFAVELNKLNNSIKSVRAGRFLQALAREELQQDKNGLLKIRDLPQAPDTYYLLELMASNDFQQSLKNYLYLKNLRKRLASWEQTLSALEEIVALRNQYYKPQLAMVDKRFRSLNGHIGAYLKARRLIDERLPSMFAKGEERVLWEKLYQLEDKHKNDNSPVAHDIRRRIKRLSGILLWQTYPAYDKQLIDAYQTLQQTNLNSERLTRLYTPFVRLRLAATQSYTGYDDQISLLKNQVQDAVDKVKTLLPQQGQLLESMAINALELRRKRLEEYQTQARIALAESYDRATKMQRGVK